MHIILKCVLETTYQYFDNLCYLSCEINDIVLCDSYSVIKDKLYGFGKNYKTNNYGLFSFSNFVFVDNSIYVNKELYFNAFNNQAVIDKERKSTPGIYHRIAKKSVGLASLCIICGEYLMGLRLDYLHCTLCNQLFHSTCYENFKTLKSCHRILKPTNQSCVSALKTTDMSITDWSNEQILQWLCSTNLFRLVDLFEAKKFTGKDVLDIMPKDENQINQENMNIWSTIEDQSYRHSLYIALQDLLEETDSTNVEYRISEKINYIDFQCDETKENFENQSSMVEIADHKFRETTFTCKILCFYCNQFLLGLHKQGFQCMKCMKNFHKTCAFQNNIRWCFENRETKNEYCFVNPIFGKSLKDQNLGSNGVPIFINSCIEELNRRFVSYKDSAEIIKCYSQSANTKDTEELKKLFSHPNFDENSNLIDLSKMSDVLVAKLIKLYFKELPEPLMTYGLFHSLVESVKDCDDRSSCAKIHDILSYLPSSNKATLRFLARHYEEICRKNDNASNIKLLSKKWSCIFSKSLIWPPHLMLNEFPNLKAWHLRIIQLIFEYKLALVDKFSWPPLSQNINLNLYDSITLSQSLDKEQLINLKSSIGYMDSDINSQDWYWSDTTKEEVNDFMVGLPDGYFMVRDSSDRSQGGIYTLTIRKDGENKLIRILYHNNLYGFQQPCQFESVPQLIKYYQSHKLSEYNDQLNLTLRYPCSKTKSDLRDHYEDCNRFENEELINLLYTTMKDYAETNNKVDIDTRNYENCQKDLDEVTKCLKAMDRIQNWCRTHSTHIMNTIQSNQGMRDHSQKCLAQLNKKMTDCDRIISEKNERRDKLASDSAALLNELSTTRPLLKKLNRMQTGFIRLLKDRGVPDELFSSDAVDNMDKLCEDIRRTLSENNPVKIRSNWFIENIVREEAIALLHNKPHGTFLIRKSSEPNKYALDIVVDHDVQHCRIFCINGMYGFVNNDCTHPSLEDLVKKYNSCSLSRYNYKLTAQLIYPVNYKS